MRTFEMDTANALVAHHGDQEDGDGEQIDDQKLNVLHKPVDGKEGLNHQQNLDPQLLHN